MSCPLCGQVECSCVEKARDIFSALAAPKFQPDTDASFRSDNATDPESYDASEERFAASLEEKADNWNKLEMPAELHIRQAIELPAEAPAETVEVESDSGLSLDSDDSTSWRDEVTARLNQYRAKRRPRGPRYPSLSMQLQFDEQISQGQSTVEDPRPAISRQAVARHPSPEVTPEPARAPDPPARIIQFPRGTERVMPSFDQLADPVDAPPRILEVEEQESLPPALGGMLLEPAEATVRDQEPGIDLPLQSVALWRRIAAALIDGLIVATGVGLFACIAVSVTAVTPTFLVGLIFAVALSATFWAGYQYLLLVYCGTTPGLRLARLQLTCFDGSPAPRSRRRWRALAAILSEAAICLGYAWCFFDEDRLCWHDRITHTCIAPVDM